MRKSIILAACCIVLCTPNLFAQSRADVIKKLEENVIADKDYQLGTEITVSVQAGQTVRLKLDEPIGPFGEVLIGRAIMPNLVFVFVTCLAGSSGGGSMFPACKGALRQIDRGKYFYLASWEEKDSGLDVTFIIPKSMEDKHRLYKKWRTRPNVAIHAPNEAAIIGDMPQPIAAERPQMTAAERVEIFVRLWSEVKYNFAFFDQVPELDWDAVLSEHLPRVIAEQSNRDFTRLVKRCVALLRDGHTSFHDTATRGAFGAPALRIEPVEGKAVVTGVAESDEIKEAGITPGTEIAHVNGRAVSTVLEEDIYPCICAGTPQDRDRRSYGELLVGPIDEKVSITVRAIDGTEREIVLTRSLDGRARSWSPSGGAFEYRQIEGDIAYVALRSFSSDECARKFDAAFDKISASRGLIIDVRENGGGSTGNGYAIISYLTDKPLEGSHWRTRKYIPTFRAWGRKEEWHEGTGSPALPVKGKKPFLGPVVVLTNAGTVSAAEDFLIPLHYAKRATLVGEPTAGTTGQPLMINLPQHFTARICTKRDTYPDGREFVGVGVLPDIEVHRTIDDVVSGRDAILERGVEVMRSLIDEQGEAGAS